jgi:threonine/homoserine/homoserine lactone efflux protein
MPCPSFRSRDCNYFEAAFWWNVEPKDDPAFLPQFIDPRASAFPQTLLLGATFIGIASCIDTLHVLSTAALGASLIQRFKPSKAGRYVTSSMSMFIGLGLYVALGPSHKPQKN